MHLNGMIWYVSLADDPAHFTKLFPSMPSFSVGHEFDSEQIAHEWLDRMASCGYQTLQLADNGWRFGVLAAFPDTIRPKLPRHDRRKVGTE